MPEQELPPNGISEPERTDDTRSKPAEHRELAGDEMRTAAAPVQSDGQKTASHYEVTHKTQKDWWDKCKPFVETAGIILLAVYTGYTIKMYRATKLSADAAKESADTAENSFQMERRRAEDQEEAVVRLRTYGLAVGEHVEQVRAVNSGKVKARNIEGHVDVSLNDADNIANRIRALGSVDVSSSELPGNEQSLEQQTNLSLTVDDWRNLADTKLVIIESGHVRYENGFGRIVDERYCEGLWFFRTPSDKNNPVQGRGNDCGQIPMNVAGVKKHPPH